MKLFINSFLLVLTLTLIGCCKNDALIIPFFDFQIYWKGMQDKGNATAIIFNKTWETSAYIFPEVNQSGYFSVVFETYSDEGYVRDVVQFGNMAARVGEYSVVQDTSANSLDDNIIYGFYSVFEDDGDVIYGGYELDTDYDNIVYIDRVDTENYEIEGRFFLLFKLRVEYYDNNLAKRVLFGDGKFKVKI